MNTNLAYEFGTLYKDLLEALDKIDTDESNENLNIFKYMEFKYKLKFRARFQLSTRKLALNYRTDNSVLQRKAQKLGFKSYREIDKKVSKLYQIILAKYPVDKSTPEERLLELLDTLFSILPEEYKSNPNTTDYLYGIIFGTTAQCFIFNE